MKARTALLVGALLVVWRAGWADERILAFDSDIRIQSDGSTVVTETLRVRVEDDRIKHGI